MREIQSIPPDSNQQNHPSFPDCGLSPTMSLNIINVIKHKKNVSKHWVKKPREIIPDSLMKLCTALCWCQVSYCRNFPPVSIIRKTVYGWNFRVSIFCRNIVILGGLSYKFVVTWKMAWHFVSRVRISNKIRCKSY